MKKDSITFLVGLALAAGLAIFPLWAGSRGMVPQSLHEEGAFSRKAAVLSAMGIAYTDRASAEQAYKERLIPLYSQQGRAYSAWVGGKTIYAVEHTGLGGWRGKNMTLVVAAYADGSRLQGVRLISHDETPGLGARIDEPWFLDQFRGEYAAKGVRVASGQDHAGAADKNPDNGLVDGISGASRTSQALSSIVNEALARIRLLAEAN